MSLRASYILAGKRTALGRLGGIHRQRRIEALAVPVVAAALEEAGLEASRVGEVIVGNCLAGGNPARLLALAAGLPEASSATTIDQSCASGLAAVVLAAQRIGAGEAEVVVAGGAEAISMAPWRIAKPRSVHQTPKFIGLGPAGLADGEDDEPFAAAEELARRLKIARPHQDDFALRTHMKAGLAREARRFLSEIVPMRATAEEARDESSVEPELDELQSLPPYHAPNGTLTVGNTSALHDGAAFVVVASEAVWQARGKPRALRLVASVLLGVAPDEEARAPIVATSRLVERVQGFDRAAVGQIEMSESSAAQAIAFIDALGLDEAVLNPDGGAIARGHPLGAAGAVLVVRLFTRLARQRAAGGARYGLATLGATGGLGAAALFEAV